MKKGKTIIKKEDDEIIVSRVCAKQGVCTKCRTLGSAVCLTCTEYQQMVKYNEGFIKLRKLISDLGKEYKMGGKR